MLVRVPARVRARARPSRWRAFTLAPGAAVAAHTFLKARALEPLPLVRGGSAETGDMMTSASPTASSEGEYSITRCDLRSLALRGV